MIYSPATYRQLEADLAEAVDNGTGICAVRYPKGAQPALTASVLGENTDSWFLENRGGDTLLVTYGRLAEELFLARKSLEEQGRAVDVLVLNRIYPIPEAALGRFSRTTMSLSLTPRCGNPQRVHWGTLCPASDGAGIPGTVPAVCRRKPFYSAVRCGAWLSAVPCRP